MPKGWGSAFGLRKKSSQLESYMCLTNSLTVVCAPQAAREQVSALGAELTLRGSLTVLDGGNRFQAWPTGLWGNQIKVYKSV